MYPSALLRLMSGMSLAHGYVSCSSTVPSTQQALNKCAGDEESICGYLTWQNGWYCEGPLERTGEMAVVVLLLGAFDQVYLLHLNNGVALIKTITFVKHLVQLLVHGGCGDILSLRDCLHPQILLGRLTRS